VDRYRRARVLGRARASRIGARRAARTTPAAHRANGVLSLSISVSVSMAPVSVPVSVAMPDGPLVWAGHRPTAAAEDIRVDMRIRRVQDLGSRSGPGPGPGRRSSGRRVEAAKRLVREHVERRHGGKAERVERKRGVGVPPERGDAAVRRIRRVVADGLVHGGLGGGHDKVLRAPRRVGARGGRRGELVKRERTEAANSAV
jgi:hypothetical protein